MHGGQGDIEQVFLQRAAHGSAEGVALIRLGAGKDLPPDSIVRLFGDDVDNTAEGIFAVHDALRASQHFDPFDVQKRGVHVHKSVRGNAVHIDHQWVGFRGDDRGRAAKGHIVHAAHAPVDGEVGYAPQHVVNLGDALVVKLL